MSEIEPEEIEYPVPIRGGHTVIVKGIPADFTPDEAKKISRVVLALAGNTRTLPCAKMGDVQGK